MSCMIMTIAVDSPSVGPQGAKEAAAMALEPLGGVRVLKVDVREPEQMLVGAMVPESQSQPPASIDRRTPAAPDGQAPAGRLPAAQRRRSPCRTGMACCMTCDFYRQEPGKDEQGKVRWGTCEQTGRPVHRLIDRCGAYVRVQA